MDTPRYVGRSFFEELRGERGFNVTLEGLWVLGALESLAAPCVAIVGTRSATAYGKRLAQQFAAALGRAGCTILSGLALGVDAAAHEGALAAGTPTIGILGGGHQHFFPARNVGLAERMLAAGGAVLSPFPPEKCAEPWQFLARNAVVAGLAYALVAIDVPARSGALNTAGHAAGRIPVFAVPGDVDRRHVAGCHALIRDGATLARDAAAVLEALHLPSARGGEPEPGAVVDPLAGALLAALADGEAEVDTLATACNATAAAALAALALLELDGRIERRPGNRYALAAAW